MRILTKSVQGSIPKRPEAEIPIAPNVREEWTDMSAETSKPDEQVHDGVQNEADPVPKEAAATPRTSPATGAPTGAPEAAGDAGSSGADVNDPTGPAEEQDDDSSDDRGLATELGPSD
jgi:hypothetical protein